MLVPGWRWWGRGRVDNLRVTSKNSGVLFLMFFSQFLKLSEKWTQLVFGICPLELILPRKISINIYRDFFVKISPSTRKRSAVADSFCESSEISRPTIERRGEYYTNFWAVRILGGVSVARDVADSLGYLLTKRVSPYSPLTTHLASGYNTDDSLTIFQLSEGLHNIYLFHNTKYPKKTYSANFTVTESLTSHPQVIFADCIYTIHTSLSITEICSHR